MLSVIGAAALCRRVGYVRRVRSWLRTNASGVPAVAWMLGVCEAGVAALRTCDLTYDLYQATFGMTHPGACFGVWSTWLSVGETGMAAISFSPVLWVSGRASDATPGGEPQARTGPADARYPGRGVRRQPAT